MNKNMALKVIHFNSHRRWGVSFQVWFIIPLSFFLLSWSFPTSIITEKRCGCGCCAGCGGCGDAFDSGGCDYMGCGCGGAPGGICGSGCGCGGCGGCGTCGTNDWCAPGTMCSNCKGGFGPPVSCSGCNTGCCPSLTFPCAFGATVNNPGCECCKEKTPPGKCKWPCMWPCCCTCTPPKFEFKPLKPEPVCHCPSPHSHHTACGHHCLRRTGVKFSVLFPRIH